jgi:hypothetical protein
MKIQKTLLLTALSATLGLWVSGCATSQTASDRPRRFHEASRVNAVLQFSSWDYTFLVQPRYQEDGFLLQVRRDKLDQILEGLSVRRDLAVVVIGWSYGPPETTRLVSQWKTILGGCGFRRVVFLRSNVYNQLNGSQIIDDSTLALASASLPSALR